MNNKKSFIGTVKLTPKYAKCDPIIIKGIWTWNEEISRWICNSAKPSCYSGCKFNNEVLELIKKERETNE